jgi:hypothetical protein
MVAGCCAWPHARCTLLHDPQAAALTVYKLFQVHNLISHYAVEGGTLLPPRRAAAWGVWDLNNQLLTSGFFHSLFHQSTIPCEGKQPRRSPAGPD